MRAFKAAFRDVYERGLMKYGFQKVKGNQPYYARCIGDEIVHVITFRDYSNHTDKEFAVLFGVATVYRKKLRLMNRQNIARPGLVSFQPYAIRRIITRHMTAEHMKR